MGFSSPSIVGRGATIFQGRRAGINRVEIGDKPATKHDFSRRKADFPDRALFLRHLGTATLGSLDQRMRRWALAALIWPDSHKTRHS
jgi:hypothetical protein